MNPSSKASSAKQVLYVDVDDEITAVIDKMSATDAKVVALVLPKRAAVFQSVVNMKLLKRRADSAKKHIVLITSESGLMPLAGLAGLHVAPTLQSKPEIPQAVAIDHADDESTEPTSIADDDFDSAQNAAAPVGALASKAPHGVNQSEDVIELDNTSRPLLSRVKPAASADKPKSTKDRKLKVPNFLRFRKRLVLVGLALVLLIIGWYFAYFVMPKATITIKTNSSDIDTRLAMTLSTAASDIDTDKSIVPAQSKQEQKSNTQAVPATGQDNKGEKASGSVAMYISCSAVGGSPPEIPAGTGVSSNGITFITQKAVTLSTPSFQGGCKFSGSTTVAAQKPGTSYNLPPSNFTVAGYSDVQASSSDAMTGGTDNNVKVVQQSDVDAAKQKLSATQDEAAIKRQLQDRLEEDGLYAVVATFFASEPNVTTSSNVGEEADNVTVTQSVTYTMFGVKKADLTKLVEETVKDKIDQSKQSVIDDGVADARFTVEAPGAGPQVKVDAALTATAGPKIDIDSLKKELTGMKTGEVKDRIKSGAGVEDVQVDYSPFWVVKAPKAEKITIQFEKSSAKANDAGDSASQED